MEIMLVIITSLIMLGYVIWAVTEICRILKITHYTLTIIYVISGYVGMEIMGVEYTSETNTYVQLFNSLRESVGEFGKDVISIIIIYTLFAIIPMSLVLIVIGIYRGYIGELEGD